MEFFKKAAIGIISGLLITALVIGGIAKLDEPNSTSQIPSETMVYTISQSLNIKIEQRKLAYQPMLIAPYETMDIYKSDELSTDFDFTSIGGYWEQIEPEGTNIEAQIRFNVDDEWTTWLDLEEEEDEINHHPGKIKKNMYAMASSNPAKAFEYRFIMYGDGTRTPEIRNADWTFIRAGENFNQQAVSKPALAVASTSLAVSNVTNSSIGVISRSGWGADESLRYLINNDAETETVSLSSDYYEKFKDELQFSKVVETDSTGKEYKWPLQYPMKVKKVVIHHTATTKNLDNPKQSIRDIYYYHSVSMGWGDIGYNYIIDTYGNIYEGRYGGEGVIGAHSGPGNNGSIGISVLGNYEENPVPEKVISSISNLIAIKSRIHGFSPSGYSLFRGINMPNIFGHKDIMPTTCPGQYLYAKLPVIRSLAEQLRAYEKPKFIQKYDFQDRTGIYYLEMKPDETREVTIKMENIGTETWNSETFIIVEQNPHFEGVITFLRSDPVILAKMNQSSIKPGDIGTFTFSMKAGKKGEVVKMKIAPVINGTNRTKDLIEIPVTVQQTAFKYEMVDSYFPSNTLDKGEDFTGWVILKNTGNTTWRNSSENTVTLGTDHPRDRLSSFTVPGSARIGFLLEDKVAPGETGKFTFSLKAPEQPGFYKEYFTPVVEGVTWMSDNGMNFETTIYGDLYDAAVLNITAAREWKQGGKYLITIKLRNLGKETWTKSNMNVVVYKEYDMQIQEATMLNDKVGPGETATLHFVAIVDENEDLERKNLLVRPKVNDVQLFKRPIYIYYNVVANTELIERSAETYNPEIKNGFGTEGKVRVKLSYEGEPQITASGAFEVYSGSNLITSLSTNEVATVKKTSTGYDVFVQGAKYSKTEPIRFVSTNGAILRISNFEHRPAWNLALNDNEYRGVLEIRTDDGALAVINELPLEDYMKGVAEVPNYEEMEKIKSVIIAARSYAKYYMNNGGKFPGKPYHLDDNPDVSQRYLGYGFEKRAPNVVKAVSETKGQFVTYNGTVVKTPYFSQSDGTTTKSAQAVWGWDAPYLVGASDAYCDGGEFLGHGVGLSGCGAQGMAEQGYGYVEILKHYYKGIEITDLY